MPRGRLAFWRCLLPVFALLSLPACLVIVSTGPTTLSGANIIFIAKDGDGRSVEALGVSVTGVDRSFRGDGITASDGAVRVAVASGVTRVRAGLELPPGYVLAGNDRWPREFDVTAGSDLQVDILVKKAAGP